MRYAVTCVCMCVCVCVCACMGVWMWVWVCGCGWVGVGVWMWVCVCVCVCVRVRVCVCMCVKTYNVPDEVEKVDEDDGGDRINYLLHFLTDDVVRVVPRHEIKSLLHHAVLRHYEGGLSNAEGRVEWDLRVLANAKRRIEWKLSVDTTAN